MSSTTDPSGDPSRDLGQSSTMADPDDVGSEPTLLPKQPAPTFRQPLRNDQDWAEALGNVTGDDFDDAFDTITSDITRPDTVPDGTPADVKIQSSRDDRSQPADDRTQQVLEHDIQEVLDIDRVEPVARVSVIAPPTEVTPSQPPVRLQVSFGVHIVVVIVASLVSAWLGCGLTLLALTSTSVQQRIFGGSLTLDRPEADAAGLASVSPRSDTDGSAARSEIDTVTPTVEAHGADGAVQARAEAVEREAGANETVEGGALASSADASAGSPLSRGDEPDLMVLPISFVRGRPRIAHADRSELQELAREILADRQSQYELVGFAAAEEDPDVASIQRLAGRRAIKARDLLRSFGPSSQRFRTRAAQPDEPHPPLQGREGEFGAVLLHVIRD